jgi:hypothetical protein
VQTRLLATTVERLQSRPATLNRTRHVEIITGSTGVFHIRHSTKQKKFPAATNARFPAVQRALVADGNGKTQPRSLPSVIDSTAPAHGSTQAVSPTACRFPPPTPDRSVTMANPPTDKNNLQRRIRLCRARESAFNGMSLAAASIYCSPRHPSALQIDPPASDGDLPL